MKSAKKLLSVLTAASVMMSLVSCDSGRNDRDDEEDSEETEVTESSAVERDELPLTPETLDGVYLTEDGFFCEFDMDAMMFRDSWGMKYDIISIGDDHLLIEMGPMNYANFSPASVLPVNDVIELDVACFEDSIDLLGHTCYRSDSDVGSQYAESLLSAVAGQTFQIGTYMGDVDWSFDENMDEINIGGIGTETTVEITDYDSGVLKYGDEYGAEGEFIFRFVSGELIWCSNGDIIQITSNRIADPSDWLLYDSDSGEVTLLQFDSKLASDDDSVPVMYGVYGSQDLTYDGRLYSGISFCDGLYKLDQGSEYMINIANPYAFEIMRRSEYVEQPEGSLSEYEYDFTEGSLTYDKYGNEWPSDVIHFYRIRDSVWSPAFPDYDTSMVISDGYYIEFNEDREAELSFDFESPLSSDVCIYLVTEDDELISVDTVVSGGTANASITEDGVYVLAYDIENFEEITEENYFATDPHDSAWARSGAAGDIPDLVDMDYIEQSYNSVFVIDSAEDLASLTYFINTYPRDYEDGFFVWVDVVDDIDLSDYLWAPIGTDDLMFCGIFCGNGHTIRGLTIMNDEDNNGFFGTMYFSNIVGLTIEEAYISGWASHIMCYDTSTTDFIDCHVEGVLPDNTSAGVDLFPDYSDYGNNGYHYCSYSITNASGTRSEDEFSSNYPHPNQENDVENHFDPDGDGVFDYSEDYFFD